MKMISFFIIFKFVNAVPPSFKREFLNELHTSLLPYKKRLAFYYMRSFERVIALFDLDISSKGLFMQLLLHLKWECYFLLPYGDLYIATLKDITSDQATSDQPDRETCVLKCHYL
jgi:hypothetical protein